MVDLDPAAPRPVVPERLAGASLEAAARARLHEGDDGGAATLVISALGPAILRYLRSMLRIEEDAADAFSRWSENVWHGLPGFRGEAALKTWCYRLARHAALNLQNEAWHLRVERMASGQASLLADSIRTRTDLSRERQSRELDELRDTLEEEDRTILVLRVDQRLSWAEVAEVLAREGTPAEPVTLMKRFERIKARLARLARQRGLLRSPT